MSRPRRIGRVELLELLADPELILFVSYGLHTSIHVGSSTKVAPNVSVAWPTVESLRKLGHLVELPRYPNQPLALYRYTRRTP